MMWFDLGAMKAMANLITDFAHATSTKDQ